MKKNLLKGIITSIFLISNILLFAQPGAIDDSGALNLEGGDPEPAGSIDSEIYLFILVGVGLAFYYFNKKLNNKVTN